MVPAHDRAIHAPLSTCAAVRWIRIRSVERIGNEPDPFPQGNTLPMIFPRYRAPARARMTPKLCPLMDPESRTAHGPAWHFGLTTHDSFHLSAPLRDAPPLTILMVTVHVPCSRSAETGGVSVLTTRAGEKAERLPSRAAATRYR